MAIILSSKFRGRTFFPGGVFFPVIIASGVVIEILTTNLLMSTTDVASGEAAYMFQAPDMKEMFSVIGCPTRCWAPSRLWRARCST